jgi:hypothetical protein
MFNKIYNLFSIYFLINCHFCKVKINKIISVVLLTCISFLLIPKDWWHECEQEKITLSKSETSISTDFNDCSICWNDFHFDLYDFVQFSFNLINTKVQTHLKHYTSVFLASLEVKFLRGPPMN